MNITCSGPGPHQPASGILGQSERPIVDMLCPSPACQAAGQAATAALVQQAANQATITQQAATALTANAGDKTQDQAIVTQATPMKTASITTLAQAQTAIQQLAQAVLILAQNDLNTKAELNSLIRLALGKFDATS